MPHGSDLEKMVDSGITGTIMGTPQGVAHMNLMQEASEDIVDAAPAIGLSWLMGVNVLCEVCGIVTGIQ